MYSLDVNFLKDRPVYGNVTEKKPKATLPAGDKVPIYIGVAVAVFFPALYSVYSLLSWWGGFGLSCQIASTR